MPKSEDIQKNATLTIREVARAAGVSTKTVSRVVNEEKSVAPDTRERVLRVIRDTGYHPHTGARSMRRKTRDCIGLTIPISSDVIPISHPTLNTIFDALSRVFASKGNYISFDLNPHAKGAVRDYARGLWEQRFGAIIIAGVLPEDDQIVRRIHDSGAPYMVTSRMDTFPECSAASVDIELGGYLSTKYLLDRGHKRIAFLKAFGGMQPGAARRRGYVRAHEETDAPVDNALVQSTTFLSQDIVQAVQCLLTDRTVTALIDSSGAENAASLREGALLAGRELGKDVEVVPWCYAFGGQILPEASATLWFPLREAFVAGMEALERWFSGETDEHVDVLYCPVLCEESAQGDGASPQPLFSLRA